MSEIYYPAGWRASVGGESAPIHRVNYLLRGVAVPAGEHEVVMQFNPTAHTAGVWIAGITTILVYGLTIALLALGEYRRRRRSTDHPAEAAQI